MINSYNWPNYSYIEGVIRFKNKVVIGVKDQLRKKIMKVALNLYIRGHASIQNSYKRLKNMFY
jgi:hypothetical protein